MVVTNGLTREFKSLLITWKQTEISMAWRRHLDYKTQKKKENRAQTWYNMKLLNQVLVGKKHSSVFLNLKPCRFKINKNPKTPMKKKLRELKDKNENTEK